MRKKLVLAVLLALAAPALWLGFSGNGGEGAPSGASYLSQKPR